MSSIVVAGDTSGTVTLQAPAVAGSTTLNLPTITGGTLVTSDSSSNVPIGNTATATGLGAAERLEIIGAGAGITGGPSALAQFRFAADATPCYQRFYKSRNTSVNGQTAVTASDQINAFYHIGSDGTNWQTAATMSSFIDGTVSTGIVPGAISIATSNSSGVLNTNFNIRANGNLEFNSGYGSVAAAYGCRAWGNFNGTLTGTITPRASGGITSITKTGTGAYTLAFSFTMPDANYSVSGSAGGSSAVSSIFGTAIAASPLSTTSAQVVVWRADNRTFLDVEYVTFAVFR